MPEHLAIGSVFAVAFVSMGATMVTYGRLVRLEYTYHREAWEKDGRPVGQLFYPPEARTLGWLLVRPQSLLASLGCYPRWALSTPDWMRQDRRALRWVFWFRVFAFTLVASSIAFLALAIVLDSPRAAA